MATEAASRTLPCGESGAGPVGSGVGSGAVTAGIWGRPADVNGDGKADILKQTGAGPTFATWDAATSTFLPLAHGVASNSNLGDANGDGYVTQRELFTYVSRQVLNIAGLQQSPQFLPALGTDASDMPLFRLAASAGQAAAPTR